MLRNETIKKMVVIESLVIVFTALFIVFGTTKAEAKEVVKYNNLGHETVVTTISHEAYLVDNWANEVRDTVINTPEYKKIVRRARIKNGYYEAGKTAKKVYNWGTDRWSDAKGAYGTIKDGIKDGWNYDR